MSIIYILVIIFILVLLIIFYLYYYGINLMASLTTTTITDNNALGRPASTTNTTTTTTSYMSTVTATSPTITTTTQTISPPSPPNDPRLVYVDTQGFTMTGGTPIVKKYTTKLQCLTFALAGDGNNGKPFPSASWNSATGDCFLYTTTKDTDPTNFKADQYSIYSQYIGSS